MNESSFPDSTLLTKSSLIPLVQHRFASHCCEALFLRSAPIVTEELATPFEIVNTENEEEHASMETLFLRVFKELDSSMGYLMTDNFASHTVRVLLLVLSGRPLHDHSTQALLQSKRKENINFSTKDTRTQDGAKTARAVPESFQGALNEIINGMVGNLDANYLRTLALQPQGNPVLQLLLELEFTLSGKQKAKDENSLFRKLVPELPPEEGTVGSQFICGLLYDSVGSHLLETIIQCSPGRVFKAIYNSQLRPKLNSILKNESASYVLLKALERLGPEDLEDAIGQLLPDIPMLLDRSKTAIIRAVIERCQVRHIDFEKLDTTLRTYYGEISQSTINSLLNLPKDDWHNMSAARRGQIETQSTARLHASLLAQTMLDSPGALRDFVLEALLIADQEDIVTAAKDKHATFVFQRSLAPTSENQKFRRKLLQKITSRFTEIALDSIGSHAFNVFWTATHDLTFIRERAAQELADCEVQIKNSFSGRIVWRNWMMDLFIRNRKTWIQRSKESDIPQSISSGKTVDNEPKKKRAIELAMERFAVNKASQSRTRSRVKMG